MTDRITLRRLDGSKLTVIPAHVSFIDGHRWDLIAGIIAEEFKCRPDDVHTEEGEEGTPDEGIEYLTAYGERVAIMDYGLSSSTIPVLPYREAAE